MKELLYHHYKFLLTSLFFTKTEIRVDIPFNALSKDHLVIDLIYNPEKTLFLERAQKQQATILNGASMLKEQAMESWRLWNK